MRINVRHIAVLLGINEKFLMKFSKGLKLACKNFIKMLKTFLILMPLTFSHEKVQSMMILCRGMLKIESNCNVIVIDESNCNCN